MVQTWVIGMVINLCGNVCINIGTNSVKYDHARSRLSHDNASLNSGNSSVLSSGEQLDGAINAPAQSSGFLNSILTGCSNSCLGCWRRFLRHGRWWYIGWSVFTVGNVANFISLSFTPQSLLAGLGSSQFLMNAVCEWYFNGIHITARMVKATVLIIIGNTLIVAFASHESPKVTVNELFQLLFEPAFDVYIVILLILTLILQIYYNETRKKLRDYQQELLAVIAAGGNVPINGVGGSTESAHTNSGSSSNTQTIGSSSHPAVNVPPMPTPLSPLRLKLLPFSYAAVSAIIGTQSVLLAKATSDLIRTSVAGDQQFTQYFTWVILACWASTIVFWLYRMDTALQKFEGPFIVPVLQVVWTLFSIIGGGIYFQEFNKMSSLALGLFALGVCIMMVGVYLLAPQHQPHHHHAHGAQHREHLVEANSMHLSDVELAQREQVSPYEVRVDPESLNAIKTSSSPPPVQIHGLFLEDGAPSSQKMSHLHPQAVVLAPAPAKITRVTSTGRMIIQNDDCLPSRDVYVEVSPDFRPFESSHNGRDSQLTDIEEQPSDNKTSNGMETKLKPRTSSMDEDAVKQALDMDKAIEKAVHNTLSASATHRLPTNTSSGGSSTGTNSHSLGVLAEAGLVSGTTTSVGSRHLSPQWSTPTRGSAMDYSRPASASMQDSHPHSTHSSIPPSPALTAFDQLQDMYGINTEVKRGRGMSLGFSMPFVDSEEDKF